MGDNRFNTFCVFRNNVFVESCVLYVIGNVLQHSQRKMKGALFVWGVKEVGKPWKTEGSGFFSSSFSSSFSSFSI